jgi:hypothetical protein
LTFQNICELPLTIHSADFQKGTAEANGKLDKTDLTNTEKLRQLSCRVMVGLHPPISAITDRNPGQTETRIVPNWKYRAAIFSELPFLKKNRLCTILLARTNSNKF